MSSTKNKLTILLIFSFSIFALIAAYFIQFILGHQPCNLCLIERTPYFVSIILILFLFISGKYEKKISMIICILFLFGAIVSFYHFGIEQGFFSESFVCDLENKNINLSASDLLKELEKNTVSCKDVTFKLLGFSLATLNTIISLIVSAIMLLKIINYDKNK